MASTNSCRGGVFVDWKGYVRAVWGQYQNGKDVCLTAFPMSSYWSPVRQVIAKLDTGAALSVRMLEAEFGGTFAQDFGFVCLCMSFCERP